MRAVGRQRPHVLHHPGFRIHHVERACRRNDEIQEPVGHAIGATAAAAATPRNSLRFMCTSHRPSRMVSSNGNSPPGAIQIGGDASL
jgi:hypothetical protein